MDDEVRARLLMTETFRSFFVDFERCYECGQRASAAGEAAGDTFCRDFSRTMAAYSLTARDRHEEAIALIAPVIERNRAVRDRFGEAFGLGIRQYGAMQTGDLAGAVALGHRMVQVVGPLGEYFGVGTLTANLALSMALAGQGAAAREVMAPIVGSVESAPDIDVVGFQVAMGQVSLRQGRWEEALAWYRRGIALMDAFGPFWTAARCIAGAVAALRHLGRLDQARDLLRRGEELTAHFDTPQLVADLTHERALLIAADDPANGLMLLFRALTVRMESGLRTFVPDSLDAIVHLMVAHQPTAACARVLAASTLARQQMTYPRTSVEGQRYHEAVERLRTALGDHAFDAAWQAGSAMPLDEAVSLLGRGRGARLRPKSGWPSLTPTEQDVVSLVVSGLSNVEIGRELLMSRSTVKTHLAHVYAKLGVGNRTELAAAASKREISA
jgi:ATP/maltotriose-dependent transcriptional regulator MalT